MTMTISISRARARMLSRALQVFATAPPEELSKLTSWSPEVCREAQITASQEAFSLKLALEKED